MFEFWRIWTYAGLEIEANFHSPLVLGTSLKFSAVIKFGFPLNKKSSSAPDLTKIFNLKNGLSKERIKDTF